MSERTASVVIACHTEERFPSLLRAISSAQEQIPAPAQVIVAVDHNDGLCARLRAEVQHIEVVDHRGDPGASGADKGDWWGPSPPPFLSGERFPVDQDRSPGNRSRFKRSADART